jgi:D-galactarolactone isomerase
MGNSKFTRRTFIKGAGLVAVAAAGRISIPGRGAEASSVEHKVPNSSGTEAPKLKAPVNTCDCHLNIYDPRFPPPEPTAQTMTYEEMEKFRRRQKRVGTTQAVMMMPPAWRMTDAGVGQYLLLQKRIGTTRAVIVTPSAYATANAVTLDGIAQLGLANARGVAVVRTEVTDVELKKMADGGIRGISFALNDPKTAVTSFEMIEPLAERANDLGWHVQLHFLGDQIVEKEDLLKRIAAPIVFVHMGRIPQPAGIKHPAFQVICRLIEKGRTWVKLSGVYQDTKVGPPTYADTTELARTYLKVAPERMVWGSGWPHPTQRDHKPNAAVLFDLLTEWAPDEALQKRVLVDNPATLYGFAK